MGKVPNVWNVKPVIQSSFSYQGRRVEDTKAYKRLKSVKFNDLDVMEQRMYNNFINTSSHEQSLQLIINSVEGDYSQLSEKLSKIAQAEDKEMGVVR